MKKTAAVTVSLLMMILFTSTIALAGTIEIWTDHKNMDRSALFTNWKWIYNEYEQQTGNKVKVTFVPFGDFKKKIVAAFAAGKAPDILAGDFIWFPGLLKDDLVAPVPLKLEKKWDSIALPVFEKMKIEGTTYGIPAGYDIYGLTYNKNMFKEAGLDPNQPPETWEEFRDYAKKLTKRDSKGKITRVGYAIRYIGYPYGVTLKYIWGFWSAGINVIDPPTALRGGAVGFNNEEGKAAVSLYRKMLHEDRSTAFGFPDPRDAFIEKKAAMQVSEVRSIAARVPKEAPDIDWGMAIPPHPEGGTKVTNFNPHPYLAVASTSDKKDLAFEFLDFLLHPQIQLYITLTSDVHVLGYGESAFSKLVTKHPLVAENPYLKQKMEMSKYGRPYPFNVNSEEALAALGKYMVMAWERKISVEEAVSKATQEVTTILTEE